MEKGYIYILRAGGFLKIGKTSNGDVKKRVGAIVQNLPLTSFGFYFREFEDYHGVEKKLHQLLGKVRVKGEWFIHDLSFIRISKRKEAYDISIGGVEFVDWKYQKLPLRGVGRVMALAMSQEECGILTTGFHPGEMDYFNAWNNRFMMGKLKLGHRLYNEVHEEIN